MRDTVVAATLLFVTVLLAAVTTSRQPPAVVVEASAASRGVSPAPGPQPPSVSFGHIEPSAPEVVPAIPAAENFSGNMRTRKFHRLSCRYAGCANCTARFATRDAALAANFDPGGCCDP